LLQEQLVFTNSVQIIEIIAWYVVTGCELVKKTGNFGLICPLVPDECEKIDITAPDCLFFESFFPAK